MENCTGKYLWLSYGTGLLAFLLLWFATDGAMENVKDPTDTDGLPAVSIYLTLMIVLMFFSLLTLLVGTGIKFLFGRLNKYLAISTQVFRVVPLFLVNALGLLVALGYCSDTLCGKAAIAMYLLSLLIPFKSRYWPNAQQMTR